MILHDFRPSQFKFLRGVVSIAAMKKIVEGSIRRNIIGVDKKACKFILIKTHGLPGAHELTKYDRIYMPIPLDSINR